MFLAIFSVPDVDHDDTFSFSSSSSGELTLTSLAYQSQTSKFIPPA